MSETPSHPVGQSGQSAVGSHIAQASGGSTAIVSVYQNVPPRPVEPDEIAAAEALLATLPLDQLPAPQGLPSPHVIPWPSNRFFVGREPELRMLARRLKQGGSAAVGQSPAVTGLGGQGKTQLAVEFAYRYGRWFKGGVFWVSCADPASIPEAIAASGPVLYLAEAGLSDRPLPERVAMVASAWANDLPRLLIFDNCEDEAILDDWAPKGGGCRLLITARRTSWSPERGVTAVPLGRLTRPESLALLRRHRPDLGPDDAGLDAIADELGHLPLALELAGSYLARYREEPAGVPAIYLAELRAADLLAHVSLTVEDAEAPGRTRSLTGHERDVARTFEVSLRRLRPENAVDALAHELFARAAWLAPGVPIPRRLLKLCAGVPVDDTSAGRRFADALNRLLDLALMERASDAGMVILHRLLAAFARSRMEQADAARRAVEAAVPDEAWRSLSQNDPRPIRDWAPHLMAVARAAGRDNTAAAVRLLNGAGYYSKLEADFDVSQAMLQEALGRAEALFGPDHPSVASTLGNLGIVQRQRGELVEAEIILTRVLAIMKKANGPDHPEVARTLTNLGNVQRERGELVKAKASLTLALAIKQKAYGPDHPEVAITLGNLGVVQRECGELEKAEASLTRALAIEEKAYGPDHPEVGRTLTDLGIVQHQRGEPAKAEASQTRALAIVEKAYGPDHPWVAITLTNLGIVQHECGELEKAEASLARALAIEEKAYGPDHPEVAGILGNLGSLRHQRGELVEAEVILTRVLAIMKKAYGPDHPEVARALTNLGNVQSECGELEKAEASLTRALAIKQKAYGPDHPEVAITLGSLGSLQHHQHRFEEARGSYKRAAMIFAAKLGEQHPYTMKARRLIAETSAQASTLREDKR